MLISETNIDMRNVTHSIGRLIPDSCHHSDQYMFFHVEWAGVERDSEDLDLWH